MIETNIRVSRKKLFVVEEIEIFKMYVAWTWTKIW